MRIAVIGGGIAGTAAAWALRRAGVEATVIHDRAGASSLYAGALDDAPWEDAAPDAILDSDAQAFAVAFEAWNVGTKSARLATYEGVLRPARGRDSALLDVAPLAGKRIAVAAMRVDGWDAAALSRSLGASPWAARTRTRFEPVAVDGVFDGLGRVGAYDLAALHDEPSRVQRLAERLRGATEAVDAWLLGPWLGTIPGAAEALSALVGKPCGETTSPPGGPAGARFDASRDALLASSGALLRRERVQSLEQRGSRFLVAGAAGGLTANDSGFDSVVLAFGGVIGGGVVFSRTDSDAAAFRPCVRVNVELGLGGQPLASASSEAGVDFTTLGMGALERVGILAEGSLARGHRSLFVAGDCVADLPRTALAAARSGILAARQAASTVTAGPRRVARS